MQIKILNDFIQAYESAFTPHFDESFEGQMKSLCKKLNEPFMHLSVKLNTALNNLLFALEKNINVAIIGQFSSGKSSLLNLILQKECLPTGVVPVTFKPTFLHYAKEYFLRVEFDDGSDEITDISELENYTDQRKKKKEAKSLHIYAPVELLKKITLIDTPGLNANEFDTLATFKELENTHAIVWLSLIDNAGKKSEEEVIKANLHLLGNTSICVLNQKDKLSPSELENVLNYAKKVFSKYFTELIAISCKEAKEEQSYEKSNFNALLDFLQKLDEKALKQSFTRRKMQNLCEILEEENRLFNNIFEELEQKFHNYENFLQTQFDEFSKQITLLNHQILEQLKAISEKIAAEIFAFVKEKELYFYKEAKGFFKKDLYVKHSYKAPYISSDDAFLAMFYNSNILNKEFKKIKNEFELSFNQVKEKLEYFVKYLQKDILLFKAEFSNIQKDNDLQSDANFSELRAFCNASEEYFLKDFKENLLQSSLRLDLFFEKLHLKAFANYENATKLSLGFFSHKIAESRTLYELDSIQFSLFYLKKSEIYERVLTELNVYEFEALLIDKPVLFKITQEFLEQSKDLIAKKKELIMTKKAELEKRKNQVLEIKQALKEGQ